LTDPELVRALFDDDMGQFCLKNQDKIERETKFVDEFGQTRWVYTVKGPIKNEAGDVGQLIGVGIDITERKQMPKRRCLKPRSGRW
jgi:PAS domain S-box-containing protein